MLLHQVFLLQLAGVVQRWQCPRRSRCPRFIPAVDDTMDLILNWYREEGLIFAGGSGAGLNISHPVVQGTAVFVRRHRQRPGVIHA